MNKNKFNYDDVIKILIKRAKGFYYTEEQYEYEKPQKSIIKSANNSISCQNISFFDNDDRGETIFNNDCDTINSSSKKKLDDTYENLTLVKKKVSTHYISPDMHAIKILFEIFREKVDLDEIDSMSDDELLNLKKELLQELNNENNQTQT